MTLDEAYSADEVDLFGVVRRLWAGKWFIAGLTILGAATATCVALWLPNQYQATAVLAPASSNATTSLSRMAGQLGGLAALASASLGSDGGEDKTVTALELLKSWEFLDQFVRENKLEVPVYAAKGWDRATRTLDLNAELYDSARSQWVAGKGSNGIAGTGPSSWQLFERFAGMISVSQDKKTGIIRLSVEYYSPDLAKEWVDKLVVAVNKRIQEQDRADYNKSIRYLQEKLKETSLTGMQLVFSRLIEEQTRNLMLADISDEYVFKLISPARVPEVKSRPARAAIYIFGTTLGAGAGALLWLAYSARRSGVSIQGSRS